MAKLDSSVIARLRKGGNNYEILVDCDKAMDFKKGIDVGFGDVIVTDEIFKDAKKGIRAAENEMYNLFGTNDKTEICKKIIKEGQVSLTADYLKRELERKRRQIIDLIHRNAVDPKTGKPHPLQRIENAIEEVKVRIDEHRPAEVQAKEIVGKINSILPVRYELRKLVVRIPAEYAHRCYYILKQYGNYSNERWMNDGSLMVDVEIPAGIQEDFERSINNLTKGNVDIKIIGRE